MRKIINKTLIGLLVLLAIWAFLTLWAERKGKSKTWETGDPETLQKILIVTIPTLFTTSTNKYVQGLERLLKMVVGI